MAIERGHEIATIDVNLVTVQVGTGDELALDTASQIAVEPQIETTDAVRLIIKGRLIAQKAQEDTLTGNEITLTDNVFTPELVLILQGGTITYDNTDPTKIIGYTPPLAGSGEKGDVFTLRAYSAQYNAAGQIVQYECIKYPNCQGQPVGLGSEDGAFRQPEYTIMSAPDSGQAPYELTYVSTLPVITGGYDNNSGQ